MMGGFWKRALSEDTTDDHFGSYAETAGLINSLYINLILFTLFMVFFEVNRHMKSTYLKRATKKFKVSNISQDSYALLQRDSLMRLSSRDYPGTF